ncbi:MAG TPA: STAS domain-containing protein [Fibrobacteria bacterium]|nr:STAS domain-containing protein [Fibrobacteria bacterium]
MEIGISKKGDLQVLSVKGKIRLQNWRVLDKHLDTMLGNGGRWVVMDLSEVTLICSTGIGALMHNVRKFREHEASLLLVASSAYMQEIFRTFGWDAFMGESAFADWRALEKRLHSQGLALTGP